MRKEADISQCGRYRWSLIRDWSIEGLRTDPVKKIVFIGLNPSTADSHQDDPTIRRCIDFSRRWGYNYLVMMNLFPHRSPSPLSLHAAHLPDEVMEKNRHAIKLWSEDGPVICCWGNSYDLAAAEGRHVLSLLDCLPLCFGTTKDGQPRHPLYIPKDAELIPYGRHTL